MPLQQSIAQFGRNSLTCVAGAKRGGGRPLFPFLPIPYPLPLPLSTPATQARNSWANSVLYPGGGRRLREAYLGWLLLGLCRWPLRVFIEETDKIFKFIADSCSNFLNVETPIAIENQTLVPFWTQTFLSIVQQIFLAFMSTGHSFKGRPVHSNVEKFRPSNRR